MVKKGAILFVVGFGLYYVFSTPGDAATTTRNILDSILVAFGQIGIFVQELA